MGMLVRLLVIVALIGGLNCLSSLASQADPCGGNAAPLEEARVELDALVAFDLEIQEVAPLLLRQDLSRAVLHYEHQPDVALTRLQI